MLVCIQVWCVTIKREGMSTRDDDVQVQGNFGGLGKKERPRTALHVILERKWRAPSHTGQYLSGVPSGLGFCLNSYCYLRAFLQ